MNTRPAVSSARAATRPGAGVLILGLAMSIVAAGGALAQNRPELSEMIDDLVTANHILYHQGVLDGFGHVSIRDPRNPSRFLMSRALAPGRADHVHLAGGGREDGAGAGPKPRGLGQAAGPHLGDVEAGSLEQIRGPMKPSG